VTRAGKEPAEDVKRRLVAVCEEIGWQVSQASMMMMPSAEARLIHVSASPPDWPPDTPVLSVMTSVPVSGAWPETVDVRCCAGDREAMPMNTVWMQGRGAVPLPALLDELQETLTEREQVLAAIKLGIPGPYQFTDSVWRSIDLFDLPGGSSSE
jgi:hypothetical protein